MKSIVNYKKNTDPIPIYIIEEHHEAFVVWNKAISEKIIPAQNNILFHFDEHTDLGVPSFNRSIQGLSNNFNSIVNFTFKEMGIASFIVPSIYLGIINQYYWFKYDNENTSNKRSICYVISYNNDGLKLISGKVSDLPKKVEFKNMRIFKRFDNSIYSIPANKRVLLDIDLDFFSCTGFPRLLNEFQIEITKREYECFKKNRYHPIYYSGVSNTFAIKKNGKYYYLINYYRYTYPMYQKKSLDQISERIKVFGQQLKIKNVHPAVITICRSRHSGYTPEDQWMEIEKLLLTELSVVYNVKVENLYGGHSTS